MIRQQLKRRLANIEAKLQIGRPSTLAPSRWDWNSMSSEEIARAYFNYIHEPLSPEMAAALRAPHRTVTKAEAEAAYRFVIGATE
jgi:hypothetical protein